MNDTGRVVSDEIISHGVNIIHIESCTGRKTIGLSNQIIVQRTILDPNNYRFLLKINFQKDDIFNKPYEMNIPEDISLSILFLLISLQN